MVGILSTKFSPISKRKARLEIFKDLRSGRISKPSKCEICGYDKKLSAHHWHGYDENNWLDVLWLCEKCHKWHDRCVRHIYDNDYKKPLYMRVNQKKHIKQLFVAFTEYATNNRILVDINSIVAIKENKMKKGKLKCSIYLKSGILIVKEEIEEVNQMILNYQHA